MNADHPVVGEFLKTYRGVIQFKDALSKLMMDRGECHMIPINRFCHMTSTSDRYQ